MRLLDDLIRLDGAYLEDLERRMVDAFVGNLPPCGQTMALIDNLRLVLDTHMRKRRAFVRGITRLRGGRDEVRVAY